MFAERLKTDRAAVEAAKRRLAILDQQLSALGEPPEVPIVATLDAAQRALEDAILAVEMGEADAGAVDAARAKLSNVTAEHRTAMRDAQQRRADAEAIRDGVGRRIESVRAELAAAEGAVQATINEWAAAELTASDRAYVAAAQAAGAAWGRHEALRTFLLRRSVPVPGPSVAFGDTARLEAIGAESAAAVMAATPGIPHGWNTNLIRVNVEAALAALDLEIEALAAPPAGLGAKIKRALMGAPA